MWFQTRRVPAGGYVCILPRNVRDNEEFNRAINLNNHRASMTDLGPIAGGVIVIMYYPWHPFIQPFSGNYSMTVSSDSSMCDNPFITIPGGSAQSLFKRNFYIC